MNKICVDEIYLKTTFRYQKEVSIFFFIFFFLQNTE